MVSVWTSNNISGLLANLGGYSAVLTGFFGLLIANYQQFKYDKTLMGELFFKYPDSKVSHEEAGDRRNDKDEMQHRIENR